MSEEDELARVIPVIQGLVEAAPEAVVSIDTTKASVARAALEAGASIINDISAGTQDEGMLKLAAETGAGLVLMHMKGTPVDMQDDPTYEDVVLDVQNYLLERAAAAVEAGVSPETIALDPGIGFGKSPEDSTALIRAAGRLVATGYPVLIGLSRKSFLASLTGRSVDERLAGSLAGLTFAVLRGVQVVRVHDVAGSVDSVSVAHGIMAG